MFSCHTELLWKTEVHDRIGGIQFLLVYYHCTATGPLYFNSYTVNIVLQTTRKLGHFKFFATRLVVEANGLLVPIVMLIHRHAFFFSRYLTITKVNMSQYNGLVPEMSLEALKRWNNCPNLMVFYTCLILICLGCIQMLLALTMS